MNCQEPDCSARPHLLTVEPHSFDGRDAGKRERIPHDTDRLAALLSKYRYSGDLYLITEDDWAAIEAAGVRVAPSPTEPNWNPDATGVCLCGGQCHHNGRTCSQSCREANERTGVTPSPDAPGGHGHTCGWCEWGRDQYRNPTEYNDHVSESGHYGEPRYPAPSPDAPGLRDLLREALHRPAVLHRPGCAEGDLLDRLTLAESFMECSCGGTSQFQDALRDERAGVSLSPGEDRLDVERLRGAFIRAGIVWVLPADLFQEAVEAVAREYAATPEAES